MDVLDRFATLTAAEPEALNHVRDFCQWVADQHGEAFAPRGGDDVYLRDYLLHLRHQGLEPAALGQCTVALKQFYAWALSVTLIERSPFDEFNFTRPYLSRDQIRRRTSALDADPQARELLHLRGLNRLTAQLNRSPDVRGALATVKKYSGASARGLDDHGSISEPIC